MPNHVKNRIVILARPEQVEEIFKKYNTHYEADLNVTHDGGVICRDTNSDKFSVGWFYPLTCEFQRRDEETTIGLPEGWKMELSQPHDQFPDFRKIIPQPENIFTGNLGHEERIMCEKEGRPNWLDWNRNNWGTKWNSYSCEKESWNSFVFETAWNGVPDLVLEMSRQNPEIEFYYEYADEDTGSNCASYSMINGVVFNGFEPESGSKEAYDLAFKLRPYYKEGYVLQDGNYVYKED